jgi:serine/threonine protein kinase HipA of HipAB toxin-antitoxin module
MAQARRKRSLNPLVITRERIQEVLDDAVERGRITRDDATDLFAELVRRGGGLVGTARRAAGLGQAFPIRGYEDLTAAQVAEQLDGLSPAELRQVRDHELRNANRKTVLSAVERKLP